MGERAGAGDMRGRPELGRGPPELGRGPPELARAPPQPNLPLDFFGSDMGKAARLSAFTVTGGSFPCMAQSDGPMQAVFWEGTSVMAVFPCCHAIPA